MHTVTVWVRVRVITSAADALLHLVELVLVDMEGEEHVGVTGILLHFCNETQQHETTNNNNVKQHQTQQQR